MNYYPTEEDKDWMQPGTDICSTIYPYKLLAVEHYGSSKREAIYRCICLRCGSLQQVKRSKLYVMSREQTKRAKKLGLSTVYPPFSGHCPDCEESEVPRLSRDRLLLHLLAANGFYVLHVVQRGDEGMNSTIGIYDSKGQLARFKERHAYSGSVAYRLKGNDPALADPTYMTHMLFDQMYLKSDTTVVYAGDGKSVCINY